MPRLACGCVHVDVVASGLDVAPLTGMSVSGASSVESYVLLGVLRGRSDDALRVFGSGVMESV